MGVLLPLRMRCCYEMNVLSKMSDSTSLFLLFTLTYLYPSCSMWEFIPL